MKQAVVALLLLVLLSPVPAVAQETVFGNIDIPQSDTVLSAGQFYLAGWTLNCYTGQQPSAVYVWVYKRAAGYVPVSGVIYWRLLRVDVANAFTATCGLLRPFLGWAIYLDKYLDPGMYEITVLFWDTSPIPAARTLQTTITITN